ncbi:putative Dynein heavy chain, N-terminal region 2 [Blattamonas nauphoetae]|uniref:Dynein heavy chain, N-terminal region 2 n=1 Tax=Blattamonas nauphoetae TaxID=2049346 RepID=A0ABQ9YIC6_9EUKA|nr:putative Dynein heavy chain, N-terminal region 2 [Blattamonas nauphoetae]
MTSPITAKDELTQDFVWQRLHDSSSLIRATFMTTTAFLAIGDLSTPLGNRFRTFSDFAIPLPDIGEKLKFSGTTNYPFDFPTFAIPSSFHAITSQEFQTMFRHFLTDTFSHTTNQHLFSAETHKSLSAPGPAHISNESIEISSPRRHYVKTDNQTFSLAVPLTVDNPPLVEINFDSLPSIPKDILNRAYIVYLLGFPDLTRLPTRIAFERQPSTPTLRFHPDPIMYDCPFCEESLVSFVTFTNHMNATHKNIDPVEKIRVVVEKRCEYIQRSVNNLRLWREILLSVKFSSDDEAEVLPSEDHNADRSKVEQSRRTLPNAPDQQSDDQEGLATQKVPAETLKFVEELLAPAAINRFVRFSFTSQMIPVLLEKIEELIQELYKVVKTDAEDLLSIVSDSFDRIQTVLNTNLGRRNISSEASYNFSDGSTGQDREVSANIGDLQNIERVSLLRAVLDGIDREPNIEEILSVTRGCLEVYSTLGTATPSPLEVTLIQQQKMVDILVGFQRYLSRWSTEKQSTLMSQFQQTRMSIVFQINMYLASLPQLGLEDDIDDTVLELSVRQRVSLVNQVAEHLQEKKHHLADVNAEAVMLSLDTTVSVELEGAINRMAYVKGLMSFYLDFLVWLGNLRISRLLEVQLDRVSSERVHFQSKLKRIHELVDVTPIASSQPHPVENRMNMELTSLRQRLFICDIDPRHMKRRHWEELATRTGKDILKRCFSIPDSEGLISPTFGELFEATIEDHEEEFRTMAVSAFHESKVETELNQMLDAWHNRIRLEFVRDDQPAFTRLQTTLYNSWADKWQFLDIMLNDCFEISDVSINNAISKAQNSLTEILALHHNKYISPFLSQLFEIRDSLLDLPSKLQLFMETQALWVNLRNLFGSRSVINQISEVHRRFVDLTEDWARLIGGILKDPTPYRVFGAGEAISHVLPHISEHLVQCKREIMPFLKMNADLYPALHLLPIDSIIASLSYAASPKDLVTVIRPLFPGITDLIVDSDQLNPLLTLRQTSNTQSSVESEDISRTDVTESSSRSPISKMEPKIAYNDNDSDSLSSITPIQRPVARPITAAIQTVQVLQPIQKDRTIYRRRHSVNVATMKQNSFHIAGPVIRLPPVNITPTQQDMMRQRRKSFAGGTTTPVAKPAGAKPTLLLKTNSRNGMVIPKAKSFQLSVKASESTTETKHVQRVIRIVGFQGCMGERVLFHEPLQFLPDGDRVSLFVGLENAIHNSVNAKMIESIVQSFPLMVLFFDSSWNIRIGPTSETGGQDNSDNVNLSDNESFSDTTSNDSREMQPFPEDTLTLLRHYSTSNIQRPQLSKDTLMDSINGITQNVAPDLAASPITYESSDSTFFDRSIVPHSARVRFNVVETAKVGPIESLTDYLSSLVPAFPLVEIKTMHRSLLKTFLKDGLDQTIFLALTTHLNKYLSENWKPTDS